ncbi:hypothetical protein AOC05_01810 [Arthrobacter alpinus]|uniref:Uncharacterized protein n=1 Tax=Arthrobacter alpinus TaxID=656366 RepID=A0A0M4RRJ9_9MICC|nr:MULTISPECIES: hypothetical protein [Arthrobacter]ALE93896.1 hypothetical protein AOC05_01810 [Arthrobacter alpinus]
MATISADRSRSSHNAAPRTAPPSAGIPVLPAVDVNLGAVTFFTPRGHHSYFCAAPALLVDALAAAVRAARWVPEIGTLVVTMAQTGSRESRSLGFKLEKY